MVAIYSKNTTTLTFENICQDLGASVSNSGSPCIQRVIPSNAFRSPQMPASPPPSISSPSPQMPAGPPPPPPKVENLAPGIEEEVADVGTAAAADDKAEAPGFSAWRDKQEMEGFDKWLEPLEKLEPVKMAQNAKKKHAAAPSTAAAAPSTGAGGSQKTAPVVSSAKTGAKGGSAVRMAANSHVSTQVNNNFRR